MTTQRELARRLLANRYIRTLTPDDPPPFMPRLRALLEDTKALATQVLARRRPRGRRHVCPKCQRQTFDPKTERCLGTKPRCGYRD